MGDGDAVRRSAKYLDDDDLNELAAIQNGEIPCQETEIPYFRDPQPSIAPSPQYMHTILPQTTPLNAYLSPSYNYMVNMPRPFEYPRSHKVLLGNLKQRLSQAQYQMVCSALSRIIPSITSITMALSEDDLTFSEHCFNRMTLEYEKFLGMVGTPSMLWRRTGEIVAVSREFAYLAGWSADQLVGYKYIFDIMTADSIVQYFNAYADVALDGQGNTVFQRCELLNQKHQPVQCTYCFMMKRDVFDLPILLVGNFLPVFD